MQEYRALTIGDTRKHLAHWLVIWQAGTSMVTRDNRQGDSRISLYSREALKLWMDGLLFDRWVQRLNGQSLPVLAMLLKIKVNNRMRERKVIKRQF